MYIPRLGCAHAGTRGPTLLTDSAHLTATDRQPVIFVPRMKTAFRVSRYSLILFVLLGSAACHRAPERHLRVLFIGNSYTYTNNLPAMFTALAADGGQATVETRTTAPGGWFLKTHWEKGDAPHLLAQGKWDYVVLQEQSLLGSVIERDGQLHIGNDEFFHPYAVMWVRSIKDAGAAPVLFLTWAHKATREDQAILNDAYLRVGRDENALVAPAGIAWDAVRGEHPEIELFQADGSHPSAAGTYLAACAFYAAVFHQSPIGLTARIKADGQVIADLPKDQARILQQAAWEATQSTQHSALAK